MKHKTWDLIALILVIIGGINWGLVVFDFNLITTLFGSMPVLVDIIYGLVGLSAIYMLIHLAKK